MQTHGCPASSTTKLSLRKIGRYFCTVKQYLRPEDLVSQCI